jgi:YggT family protein
MTDIMGPLAGLLALLRTLLLGVGALAALAAALAWAVRTRRLAPFSFGARFARKWIDPLLMPVERVVVRAGGHPTSAPWWGLVVVAVAGALILTGVQALAGLILEVGWALSQPWGIVILLLSWTFTLLRLALIVRVIASWLPIPRYSRWIKWTYPLTEWILRPLRSLIPPFGMIDITPVVAYFLLWIVQSLLHIP